MSESSERESPVVIQRVEWQTGSAKWPVRVHGHVPWEDTTVEVQTDGTKVP